MSEEQIEEAQDDGFKEIAEGRTCLGFKLPSSITTETQKDKKSFWTLLSPACIGNGDIRDVKRSTLLSGFRCDNSRYSVRIESKLKNDKGKEFTEYTIRLINRENEEEDNFS